jgi:hypothetical protein
MDFMKAALAGKEPGEFQLPQPVIKGPSSQKLDTPDTAPAGDETH